MATQLSIGAISLSDGAETLGKQGQYLTIDGARNSVREQFANYHQLLNTKELELISELDQLETTNEPELTQVQNDLKRLRGVVDSLNDSLGTNTLKLFLEKQKSIWDKEIKNFDRSEELLSHVTLNYSDFDRFVNRIIEIVPFRTKAKFRSDLEPLLKLEPELGEEWFVVSAKWFSSFTASINLKSPQNYDSWEFPERIPFDNSSIYTNGQITEYSCKKLHSKAWDMLLGYHKTSPGYSPIKRVPFFNPQSQKVELPIVPIVHKCFIGYSGTNQFNIQIELKCLPTETYEEILERICKFSDFFTTFTPQLFCFSGSYGVNFQDNKYTISKLNTSTQDKPPPSYLGTGTTANALVQPILRPLSAPTFQQSFAQQSFLGQSIAQLQSTHVKSNPGQSIRGQSNPIKSIPVQPFAQQTIPVQSFVQPSVQPIPGLPPVEPFYPLAPLKDLKSQIGLTIKLFLFVIPNSAEANTIQVITNIPELK